jgi:[ribosomal protein S18]-alanine N-acetyltransferase
VANDPVVVRPAATTDLDAMIELERVFPSDRMSRRAMARHLRSGSAWVGVADRGGELVAYAMVLFRRDRPWGRLYSIVVDPRVRGQGIAGMLITAAEDEARRRGMAELRLEVRADNAAALAVYVRHGYAKIGSLPRYYSDLADGVRLARRW